MGHNNEFSTIENAINIVAQDIAIKLNARTVIYKPEIETWTYYCPNNIIHKFTKKDLTDFFKKSIDREVNKYMNVYSIKK